MLYLWVGQIVSRSGDFIFDVAFVLLVLKVTGSVFDVGLVAGVSALPNIFAPLVGVFADRTNRRTILLWSNVAQALVCSGIALLYSSGHAPFPIVLVLLLLLNTGGVFVGTSLPAMIPRMVAKDDLAAANGLFSITGSFNQLLFYGVGGAVVALIGYTVPIYYDALTFVFALVTVLLVPSEVGAVLSSLDAKAAPFFTSLREGFVYVRRNALLFELVCVAVVVNFFLGAVGALIAPFTVRVLGAPDSMFGFVLTALAAGALVGATAVGKVQIRGYVGKLTFAGIAGIGISVVFMSLVVSVPSAFASFALVGALSSVVNIPISVLIQAKVPNEMMGRVVGTIGACATLTVPVASVASGGLASVLSIAGTYELFGTATVITAVVSFIAFRDLRDARY
ncbi:MAG TPA: MFS transporter [Nitrososphaerales archaeon]|nr:MFS transporter [Nitrososphaerales archaeon]